ncbi:MAG TPA: hypothetical protein VGO86_09135 [Candidatus Dormibacteraeota bacterium]
MRGTAWGAWQAVVTYNDHGMTSRTTRTSTAAETRFERILGGENIGSRALALLSQVTAGEGRCPADQPPGPVGSSHFGMPGVSP